MRTLLLLPVFLIGGAALAQPPALSRMVAKRIVAKRAAQAIVLAEISRRVETKSPIHRFRARRDIGKQPIGKQPID